MHLLHKWLGFNIVEIKSHSGRLSRGNNAPLRKKRGRTTKLTIIWNPSKHAYNYQEQALMTLVQMKIVEQLLQFEVKIVE